MTMTTAYARINEDYNRAAEDMTYVNRYEAAYNAAINAAAWVQIMAPELFGAMTRKEIVFYALRQSQSI